MNLIKKSLIATSAFSILSAYSLMVNADTLSQTYSVDEGETLFVKTDAGSINVKTHNSDSVEIEVEISGRDADKFDVTFEQSSSGVNVFGERDEDWGWGGHSIKVKFYFYVPENYDLDLDTAGGSIKIEDLTGNVEAQTSGGSISLGDIVGDVDVNTSGGSIKVDSVYGEIDANTSGGSINVEFKKQITENAKLTTSGGSITATLPDDIEINLLASTSGGRVSTEFDVDGRIKKQSIKGKINGGGPDLKLQTSGGSVRINKS